MKFTTSDLFALTFIAAFVFGYGVPATAADSLDEVLFLSVVFGFAAIFYGLIRFAASRFEISS